MIRRALTVAVAILALAPLAQDGALALPDARLTSISAEGMDLHEGDRVPLTIEVRNSGDAPLPPVPVSLSIDEVAYSEWRMPGELAPHESVTWELTWVATRGGHLLSATVDPLNDVVESDETNNSTFINVGAAERERSLRLSVPAVGVLAFLVGAGAAVLLRRRRPRPKTRPPSRRS